MRKLLVSWRRNAKPATLADYRRSMLFDGVAALAIITYIAASYGGPPPTWAKMVYLGGIIACSVAASSRRSWLTLTCLAVLTAIALNQVISGEWLVG